MPRSVRSGTRARVCAGRPMLPPCPEMSLEAKNVVLRAELSPGQRQVVRSHAPGSSRSLIGRSRFTSPPVPWNVKPDGASARPYVCRATRYLRGFSDRLQRPLQTLAEVLVPGGEFQRRAQMGDVLVAVEAGLVGGDCEEDAARCAKVDRPEVIPVDHRRHVVALVEKCLAQLELAGLIFHRKGDVMHRARALLGRRGGRHFLKIYDMCPVALGNREARYPALGPDEPEPHEAKKLGGGRVVLEAHRHGVKSANRHVFGHAAPGPRLPVVAFVFHKCEAVAVGAGEGEELLPEAASLFEAPYVSTREASRPGRKTVLRHRKCDGSHFPDAGSTSGGHRERKIGHHRAGRAVLVPV